MGRSTKTELHPIVDRHLRKISKRLCGLEGSKQRMEGLIVKYLKKIASIERLTEENEIKVEKLLQKQAAYECGLKIQEKICHLQSAKKRAEEYMNSFTKKLCMKMKRLQKCRKYLR